ncbi:hypothetical protein Patl1_32963 [Pistacia atlantica]|uniref:Uncharacterized protein n=1 Tax=Pistacia atlantica TaxID=434234 RepID=A0ACC1AR88_9ROSI|nr:hypothetical protein Patl1_32963 [Pistacia atlantica]
MEFKHFSHPHILRLYYIPQGQEVHCSGCESSFSGSAYGCAHCQYFLHEHCAKASPTLQHSTHSLHHLTLPPPTTYSAGSCSCSCNAFGSPGTAFSFVVHFVSSIFIFIVLCRHTFISMKLTQMSSASALLFLTMRLGQLSFWHMSQSLGLQFMDI